MFREKVAKRLVADTRRRHSDELYSYHGHTQKPGHPSRRRLAQRPTSGRTKEKKVVGRM